MSRDAKKDEVQEHLPSQQHSHTRQTKFTPENMRQIVNLVERGKSKEQIAEIVGVTVGTLQVTCSKLGISLRPPRFNTGTYRMLRRRRLEREEQPSLAVQAHSTAVVQNDKVQDQPLADETAVMHGKPPSRPRERENGGTGIMNLAIKMLYKGQQKTSELPLSQEMIAHLALEAEFRSIGIGELMRQLIVAVIEKDVFKDMLDENSGAEILDQRTIRHTNNPSPSAAHSIGSPSNSRFVGV
jgi:transposase-like protein